MSSVLRRLVPFVLPAASVVFLLLWITAEAGRMPGAGWYVELALYAVAIALARLRTEVSLAVVVAVPLLQLAGLLPAPESTSWPVTAAVFAVAAGSGFSSRPLIRWLGLAAGIVQALIVAVAMVYAGDWRSWTGFALDGGAAGGSAVDSGLRWVMLLAIAGGTGYLLVWAAGLGLRVGLRRHEERELLHQVEAELALADFELRSVKERDEIAHEVHDVVAHSLAVVIAVADGSRYLRGAGRAADSEQRTDEALGEIADTARAALIDLRGLLEGLSEDAGRRPQPTLADLDALVTRITTTGMRVELEHFGEPRPLTPSQELSVYRIVQESLTNALKHGGTQAVAAVSFAWEGEGLALTIASRGDGAGAPAASGAAAEVTGGFGIRGMKDRAHLAGGWLTAGRDDGAHTDDGARTDDDRTDDDRTDGSGDPAFLVTAFIPALGGTRDTGATVATPGPDGARTIRTTRTTGEDAA